MLLNPPLSTAVATVGGEMTGPMPFDTSDGLFEIGIDCSQAPVKLEPCESATCSEEFKASSTAEGAKSFLVGKGLGAVSATCSIVAGGGLPPNSLAVIGSASLAALLSF